MVFKTLIKALKPFRLISLVTTYLLGAGLVQYVREMKSWSVFIQGGVLLLLISLSVELLGLLHAMTSPQSWPDGITFRDVRQIRWVIAMLTGTLLTVATTIFITWMQVGILWQGLAFLLGALLIVGGFYYLSQIVEILKRYQLLIEVLLYVVIPPGVAYFLQSTDLHRLLTMVVISLVPGYLANRLLGLLQRFGRDHQLGVSTLVTAIGWENAMFYHNALILLTYFLFALITLVGFPWFLIWPVFLTLPIGLVSLWLMERVRQGMKPLWRVMRFATASVFFIPIYLIGFAFWIR